MKDKDLNLIENLQVAFVLLCFVAVGFIPTMIYYKSQIKDLQADLQWEINKNAIAASEPSPKSIPFSYYTNCSEIKAKETKVKYGVRLQFYRECYLNVN